MGLNKEKRILLDDVDFEKLTKGEIIEKDGVKIALSEDHRSWEIVIDKNIINDLEKNFQKIGKAWPFANFVRNDMLKNVCDDDIEFIEYTDNDDNYIEPERNSSNELVDIRLYCLHKGCKQYIKGKDGYNGKFITENGKQADLRNQCWLCKKHENN